jgi:hypothetical protein
MAKQRKSSNSEDGYTLKELMIRHGLDPADQLFRLISEVLPYPDTGDPERDKQIMDSLKESYEPFEDEKGRLRLRLKTSKRIEILKELMGYTHPKLRGMEIRGTVDHTFNISIQTFDDYGPKKVLDIIQPIAQLNDSNRESGQSIPDGTVNGGVP